MDALPIKRVAVSGANKEKVLEKSDITEVVLELETGARFKITVDSIQARGDCLNVQMIHPGHVYTSMVVPVSISTIRMKPLVID